MGGGCGPGLVAIHRHIVFVVSSLCGLVVMPSFCVLVVVSLLHVHRLSWVCRVMVMVVVVWCGRRVHGVNDNDEG